MRVQHWGSHYKRGISYRMHLLRTYSEILVLPAPILEVWEVHCGLHLRYIFRFIKAVNSFLIKEGLLFCKHLIVYSHLRERGISSRATILRGILHVLFLDLGHKLLSNIVLSSLEISKGLIFFSTVFVLVKETLIFILWLLEFREISAMHSASATSKLQVDGRFLKLLRSDGEMTEILWRLNWASSRIHYQKSNY